MWNCLPLTLLGTAEDEDIESSRREGMLTSASMRKRSEMSTSLLISTAPSIKTEPLVAEAAAGSDSGAIVVTRRNRWASTGPPVTLWFGNLVEYLGQALLRYLAGVTEKLEKQEYY